MNIEKIENTNGFCIDYLTITFRVPWLGNVCAFTRLECIVEFLSDITDGFVILDKFSRFSYGLNHFNRMLCFGGEKHFIICAADDVASLSDMIMIQISGRGVTDIGTERLFAIMKYVHSFPVYNCSRIDLAYDDYLGVIPVNRIVKSFISFRNGNKVLHTRFKRDSAQVHLGSFNDIPSSNVTFGRRKSSQYFRLYDKRAEQGIEHCVSADVLPEYWYRLELELRKDVAKTVFDYIVVNDFDIRTPWQLYLNRMFRILEREATGSELTHIERVPTANWWSDFVQSDSVGKVHYTLDSVDNDIDRMVDHICRNYLGYLYVLQQVRPRTIHDAVNVYGKAIALEKSKYNKILNGGYDREF